MASQETFLSLSFFITATFLTIYSYKVVPLSAGPILGASEYIFIAFLSKFILKERISTRKVIGLGIIIIGVLVFSIDISFWTMIFR